MAARVRYAGGLPARNSWQSAGGATDQCGARPAPDDVRKRCGKNPPIGARNIWPGVRHRDPEERLVEEVGNSGPKGCSSKQFPSLEH